MSINGSNSSANTSAPNYKVLPNSNTFGTGTIFGNTTQGAFTKNITQDIIAVNTSNKSSYPVGTSLGWVLQTTDSGPVANVVLTNGSLFSNGQTFTISNGNINATGYVTTNSTGNLVSGTVTTGGNFTNSSIVSFAFDGLKSVNNNITISAGGSLYNNTDVVKFSNGVSNGTGTLATNSTGGITSITVVNPGVYSNTAANASVVISFANSTGGNSSGSGATATAVLVTGTGGNAVISLCGRAGRVRRETLIAMGSLK